MNSIEQANAAFRCQSDGYFADVAYGYVSFFFKVKINFSIKILKTFSHSKKNKDANFIMYVKMPTIHSINR